jgi:hypothetical protein
MPGVPKTFCGQAADVCVAHVSYEPQARICPSFNEVTHSAPINVRQQEIFMSIGPGTVSNILWHFTGGPRWNITANRQEEILKPPEDAYKAFLSIMSSKELRIGNYKEVVKVQVPLVKKYNRVTKQHEEHHNVLEQLESSPVCCLADIPIAHLPYHAIRYGKFAIGFRRESAIRAGFNPVFYTLHDTAVANAIYQGLVSLKQIDTWYIRDQASDIESAIDSVQCEHGHDVDVDVSSEVWTIESEADDLESKAESALEEINNFLAYVKTFEKKEFQTIYCEREWRSVSAFSFSFDDVAMLVLPRNDQPEVDFFDDLVSKQAHKLNLARRIPIVPWEDLLEH